MKGYLVERKAGWDTHGLPVEMEVEKRLVRLTPEEFRKDAHHWLILHGRYICVARKPKCGECNIADLCDYKHKTVAAAPKPARGPGKTRASRKS